MRIEYIKIPCYNTHGKPKSKGGLPSSEGLTLQTKERRAMLMITYQDFFLFCTFIVALISLLCQIFRGKK